ncbi:MAG: hypothetical protein ACQEXJ_18275 [Myxococcota bacterium]
MLQGQLASTSAAGEGRRRFDPGGCRAIFLRSSLSLNAEIGVPLGERVAVSFGWDEQFYIPQGIAGPISEGPGDRPSIWHVSVGYVKLRVRLPYTTSI